MAAATSEACERKHSKLWGDVVVDDRYICKKCSRRDKNKYVSAPFSYFAVCILDDNRTTGLYYVVSRKDLYEQHRAVEGKSTENLNPVIGMKH